MARFLIALLFIAVTVFAVADWAVRSKTSTPGRLNRWVWLAVILLIPMVGPLTWIIVGAVTRAEEKQGRYPAAPEPIQRGRPDDNPEAISDVVDRINRRQRRTKPEPRTRGPLDPAEGPSEGTDLPKDAQEPPSTSAEQPKGSDKKNGPDQGKGK